MLPGISESTLLMDIPTGCIERPLNPNISLPLMAAEAPKAIDGLQGGART